MDLREATPADIEAIRSIATDSLSETYGDFLDDETIDDAVDDWYGEGFLEELEADQAHIIVVERNGEPAGFAQSDLVGGQHKTGRILWLHIDPDHRGDGTGVRLLVRTRERLRDEGTTQIQGFVLEDNEAGNEFYRSHGFEQAGQREVDVGGETFTENVYTEGTAEGGWGGLDDLEVGGEVYAVSYGEATRGAASPFYRVYESDNRETPYGWLCGSCNSTDSAMDAMGRIECNDCGNRRKATRWDASYL